MIIKFSCKNHCLDFEKDELEIIEQSQSFTHCAFCGEKLAITNLTEIVESNIEKRVSNNIDKWVKTNGWDYVIDLVKRYKNYGAVGQFYVDELEKRGFKI